MKYKENLDFHIWLSIFLVFHSNKNILFYLFFISILLFRKYEISTY